MNKKGIKYMPIRSVGKQKTALKICDIIKEVFHVNAIIKHEKTRYLVLIEESTHVNIIGNYGKTMFYAGFILGIEKGGHVNST